MMKSRWVGGSHICMKPRWGGGSHTFRKPDVGSQICSKPRCWGIPYLQETSMGVDPISARNLDGGGGGGNTYLQETYVGGSHTYRKPDMGYHVCRENLDWGIHICRKPRWGGRGSHV